MAFEALPNRFIDSQRRGDYILYMKSHRDIERRSLALMQTVAAKIDHDPQKQGIEKARQVCARCMEMHDNFYIK